MINGNESKYMYRYTLDNFKEICQSDLITILMMKL